jgi:hypothetical protein
VELLSLTRPSSTMARSKNATRKGAPRKLPPHVPVVPEPEVLTYTVPELLLHAAQFISASEFDDARNSCLEAVKLADKEQDSKGMCETLEMLGMVQLELGELEEAREVSNSFETCHGGRETRARLYRIVTVELCTGSRWMWRRTRMEAGEDMDHLAEQH